MNADDVMICRLINIDAELYQSFSTNVGKSRSLRSSREGRKGSSFLFITISVLTFLYTSVKALHMGIVLSDSTAAWVSSYLQCLTSTAIVLLKISIVLFAGSKFRGLCVIVMALHITFDIIVTVFALQKDVYSSFIPLFGTLGSFMDLNIYSIFLRLKAEKMD